MAICKRKVVAALIIISVGIGALAVRSGQSATNRPERENSKLDASSLFAGDPNFSARSDSTFSSQEMFFKLMLSVLLVAVLGAAAIYASKKLLPRITNLPGKKIRIVETVHLGPRKAVHLLEIGNQRFLIGSTNESITKLADVTYAFAELLPKEADDEPGIYDR
ncbi:MAG: flagellar biosynthetic protein FliO [Planctomycetota bacterium]|nr:flagellar biosynthetic protein FliO [Planctomycetota bacterium]